MSLPVASVQKIVGRHYGLTRDELVFGNRSRRFAYPRFVAMALCREQGASLPRIGQQFNGMDHTSVLSALRRIKATPALMEEIEALRAEVAIAAELHELDALSGRVYLAAEKQATWVERAPPPPRKYVRDHKREYQRKMARVTQARDLTAFRTDAAVPSAWLP